MKYGKESEYDNYEGAFKDGKFHGNGTLLWKNGDLFSGQFQKGFYNGYGKITYGNESDYENYEGTFKNGYFNGNGTMTLKNGDIYVGQFKDDLYNGYGVYTFANENVLEIDNT